MGLSDELTNLQNLHEKGKLTDQEFADAKAATLRKYQEAPAPVPAPVAPVTKPRSGIGPRTVGLLLLLGLIAWIWYNAGTKKTSEMLATAVHAPITVKNDVENLPASSWKALAVHLPYSGTVKVDIHVVRGNPLDVFLTTPDQLDAMNKSQWSQVRTYTDFNAAKSTTYRRTGQLGEGDYYLVLRDTSLGILSQSASDVSVNVQLNP
jgi:hypothetical protein